MTDTVAPKVPDRATRKRVRRAQHLRARVAMGRATEDQLRELADYEAAGGHRAQTLDPSVMAALATTDQVRAGMATTSRVVAATQTPPHFDFVTENRTQVAPNQPGAGVPLLRDQVELPHMPPVPGGEVQTTVVSVPPPAVAPPPKLEAAEVQQVAAVVDPQLVSAEAARAELPPGIIASMYTMGASRLHAAIEAKGGVSMLHPKDAQPFAVEVERTIRAHIGNGGKVDFAAAVAIIAVQGAQLGLLTWLEKRRGGLPAAVAAPKEPTRAQAHPAPDLYVVGASNATSGKDVML